MINVKEKSKIHLHWKVSPYDYTKEKEKSLEVKLASKYGLPKDRVKVIPDFILLDDKGKEVSLNHDIIQNIQDPNFQVKLFADWLTLNNVKDYDFELIKKIDSEINAKIDYQIYDKYKRYSVKWIRWSNFLCYGPDNYFDFTNLGKLVLLTSEPANQGGKTTFCIDLLKFLLFGSNERYKTQAEFFNKHIPSATNIVVEGCICIDNVDYVIKRTITRPALERRSAASKTTQKVEYYKIVGGDKEELEEYIDNQQEENSIQTNKAIKEAIGRESDFDLIMSVSGKSLDDLIEKKDTERGRLLSRWIGLLPIEEKDIIAREKYNTEVKPFLLSNRYNTESLTQEIQAFEVDIKTLKSEITKYKKENKVLDDEIKTLEKTKETLLASKKVIDENVLKIDITTLKRKMNDCITNGKNKKAELELIEKELKEIGNVDFSVEQYDKSVHELSSLKEKRGELLANHKSVSHNIEHLKNSEICPVCKRKLDNVDNTAQIKEQEKELDKIVSDGKKIADEISKLEKLIESMKTNRELYTKKTQNVTKKAARELNIERLRNDYKDFSATKKEYDANSEAIDKNNAIDIQIRNNDIIIRNKRNTRDSDISKISNNEATIKNHEQQIKDRKELIKRLAEEEILIRNWKIYLDLVGKNGITKMVLRKTLPIINARLAQMLNDICDFDVEVTIDEKNDVKFLLLKDGKYSNLHGASGFELTASALALRAVLADMSTIARCNMLVFDEVMGRVSSENYENIRNLLERISKSYETVLFITHNSEIKDWFNNTVVVRKENNISKLSLG
jgi:DNA repair exonuclease SbcCD ATPase subunit